MPCQMMPPLSRRALLFIARYVAVCMFARSPLARCFRRHVYYAIFSATKNALRLPCLRAAADVALHYVAAAAADIFFVKAHDAADSRHA